ncbi:hypothetical protein ACH4OY_13205 [Micromonospora rubida]|uniref:Phage tail protein n=1 Tax=Micromonospora rubida TaxID=2697657 RepID=A0ABW7SKG0_9ACTN
MERLTMPAAQNGQQPTKPATGPLDGATPADLLPASGDHPVEIVRYQSVVLTDIPGAKPARKLTGAIDLGEENLPFYDRPAEGMIVTTEQSWAVKGVTLGRLLHSLALAPGESTRVAVVDWERRTRGTGTEATSEKDQLTSRTDQDRSISEVANTIAQEQQHGTSSMQQASTSSSKGGGGGVALFGVNLGGTWSNSSNSGFATNVVRSTGIRSVASDAAQQISARTQQVATAARSRHMTVVRETSQSEKEQVTTRVVTNYNHMHALSVQYYEVVQVYEVTTKPVTAERCLFIPLQELSFTHNNLQRYKEVLASVAPKDWATRIRDANPLESTVRKLEGCTAAEAPANQLFEGIDLLDLAASAMGVYGVRKLDGAPVRFDSVARQWNPLPTTGLPASGLKRIAPGKDKVWGVRPDNRLMIFDGTTWHTDPHGAAGLGVASGSDGTTIHWNASEIYQQVGINWQKSVVAVDDLAVVNNERVWYCKDGKTFERTGTTWTERPAPAPGIVSLTVAPDGVIWGVTGDKKIMMVEPGSSTWTPGKIGTAPMTAAVPVKIVSAGGGEFWLMNDKGVLYRLLTAPREALTAFDDPPPPESGWPTKIDVWWDNAGIRSVRLVIPGHTYRCGDTGGSGVLQHGSYDFKAGEKLLSVDYWTGTAARGSLAGLRLTLQTGMVSFGPAAGPTTPDLTEDAGGAAICGLLGSTVRTGSRTYIAALGFHLRGGKVPQAVLDHLNDNRRYYSQAVWANADELTLSRILANYSYLPPGGKGDAVPLGMLLDPKPVAATGNYLGFRWNFSSEQDRQDWLKARSADSTILGKSVTAKVGIATNGVFAEAVLGRANAAEKIDLTRFWNWKDSPIPILPTDIAAVSTGTRNQEVDVKVAQLGASEAKFQTIAALPDPAATQAAMQVLSTANLFKDIAGAAEMSQMLSKGIEAAANNDKDAGARANEAMKTAAEHQQKMATIAVEAASKLVPAGKAASSLSALGGMMNQASNGNGSNTSDDSEEK